MSVTVMSLGSRRARDSQEAWEKLVSLVAEMTLCDGNTRVIECGPLEINCFSLCFWARVVGQDGGVLQNLYVKIPKRVLYDPERQDLLPLTTVDRTLAKDEYLSLVHLSKNWNCDDLDVRFVKPLGFVESHNAIVTERFFADEFWRKLRDADLREWLFLRRNSDSVKRSLFRMGAALRRFHEQSEGFVESDSADVFGKIQGYVEELRERGADPSHLDRAVRAVRDLGSHPRKLAGCKNLKGLDIRQVFIGETERLYLLDPGRMKDGHSAVDLARFLVTCRIVYWGSLGILFGWTPNRHFEQSFLSGYGKDPGGSEEILRLYIVKELFKHWKMAQSALEMRRWPRVVRYLLGRFYIDPFYRRQIQAELACGVAS